MRVSVLKFLTWCEVSLWCNLVMFLTGHTCMSDLRFLTGIKSDVSVLV